MPHSEWIEPRTLPAELPRLHLNPLLNRLLASRVTSAAEANEFLDSTPRPHPDPFLLSGMADAIDRVRVALARNETIAVYGDYDVDGIAATAILIKILRAVGVEPAKIIARLPIRSEGYGLNIPAIDALAGAGARLLISVDCGSTDHDQIAHAQHLGLDVIVIDHHQMTTAPVGAITVSSQLDCDTPYRELSATGLAYLFAVGLANSVPNRGFDPRGLLDLVALGTVGDVVPLRGWNRIFVREGLRAIATRPGVGLTALCACARLTPAAVTSEDIAFGIAPRINAAGRMDTPRPALDLLLTDDRHEAGRLAAQLERFNLDRRSASKRVEDEALAIVAQDPRFASQPLLIISQQGWRSGVLGLTAGKLVERFGRPVIVLSDDGQSSRGSARSVPGFDIGRALAASADLLQDFGGHERAAGLSLLTKNVPDLEEKLIAVLEAAALPPPAPPAWRIDADLTGSELTLKTAELIYQLQPFGQQNPLPVFRVRGLNVRSYSTIGKEGSHLKLHLETPQGQVHVLAWGAAARSRELVLQPRIDLVATLGFDYWQGRRRLHIEAKDFRLSP